MRLIKKSAIIVLVLTTLAMVACGNEEKKDTEVKETKTSIATEETSQIAVEETATDTVDSTSGWITYRVINRRGTVEEMEETEAILVDYISNYCEVTNSLYFGGDEIVIDLIYNSKEIKLESFANEVISNNSLPLDLEVGNISEE